MRSRAPILLLALSGAVRAAGAGTLLPDPVSAVVSPEFRSAYQARGLIVEDRPVLIVPAYLNAKTPHCGMFSVWSRTLSSLTDRKSVQKCEELYERDWGFLWRYDWRLTDDLTLRTDIDKAWLTFHSYRSPARGDRDHTLNEWRLRQELRNPLLTPFYFIRRGIEPVDTFYIQLGVKRTFDLTDSFAVAPQVFTELGNARLMQYRYGKRTDSHDWKDGVQSLNARLDLTWKVTECLSFIAGLHEFITVNEPARRAIKAKTSRWSRRDLTIASCGVRLDF